MTSTPQDPDPSARREVIASHRDYLQAQAMVDHLSDQHFPVEHTAIIGVGVRMVEQVTGRMTLLRAAGSGAAAGAWFGLLLGLFLALFAVGATSLLVLALGGLLWGAAAGAVFGLVGHALTRGVRDFASYSTLRADRYDVVVDTDQAEQARELLSSWTGPA